MVLENGRYTVVGVASWKARNLCPQSVPYVYARVTTRKNWIKEGEMEVFRMRAPSSMKFDDLCTLSLLLLDENFEEAKELVAKCMSPAQQASSFRRDSNIYDSLFPMR